LIEAGLSAFNQAGVGPSSHELVPAEIDMLNSAEAAEIMTWAMVDETLNFCARRYPDKRVFVASRAGQERVEEYNRLVLQSILLGRPLWIFSPAARTFLYVAYPQLSFKWLMSMFLFFAVSSTVYLLATHTITFDQLILIFEVVRDLLREFSALRGVAP
jgi:hypothetical protein